jgi:hypothetical protein
MSLADLDARRAAFLAALEKKVDRLSDDPLPVLVGEDADFANRHLLIAVARLIDRVRQARRDSAFTCSNAEDVVRIFAAHFEDALDSVTAWEDKSNLFDEVEEGVRKVMSRFEDQIAELADRGPKEAALAAWENR